MNLALEEARGCARSGPHRPPRPERRRSTASSASRACCASGGSAAEDAELLAFVEQAVTACSWSTCRLDMFQMERGSYTYVHAKGGRPAQRSGQGCRDLAAHARSKRVEVRIEGPRLHALAEELLCFSDVRQPGEERRRSLPRAVRFCRSLTGDEKRVIAHNAGAVPKPCARASSTNTRPPAKQSGSGLVPYSRA